jgi:hypothetical protein
MRAWLMHVEQLVEREFCFYFREHGNESLDSLKAGLILGQLSDY